MKNKVAYITGGTKGIGFGIAKALHDQGIIVAISGRNKKDALETAQKLSTEETPVFGLRSDVKNFEDEQNAVAEIMNKFGQIDYVIANAGVGIFKPVDELSLDDCLTIISSISWFFSVG